MSSKRILIVDDEIDIREILQFNLENEGYEVRTASSGEEALEILSSPFDLVLLDIMMGGISGLRVAEKMRKGNHPNTPIIFLTAKVTENDMLTGFSIGADDYMTKPFSIKELIARCRAILRRSTTTEEIVKDIEIVLGDIVINNSSHTLTAKGENIPLTKKEFDILSLLASSEGRTFSREEIMDKVWREESYVLERTVDVHIARLRKKLADIGGTIVNRSGYGYSFKLN